MARPWILTSFSAGDGYRAELEGMVASFSKFHKGVPIVVGFDVVPAEWGWRRITCFKAEWLRRVYSCWTETHDVLWVDADARFRREIQVPNQNFQLGAKKYHHLSTGTLWLKPGLSELLEKWVEFAVDADHDEDALIRACRACDIGHHELPDKMTSPCTEQIYGFSGKLWHDAAIIHWNRARRTLGYIENWPPSEEERELAAP